MQDELNAEAESRGDKPWGSKVTWAKVGGRMGLSRQRIHQLIQLLRLPEEIREAVRSGTLSERDARLYQGLEYEQQADLFQAVALGRITTQEAKKVSTQIKRGQSKSVESAIRALQSGEISQTKPKPPRRTLIDRGNQSRLEQAQALLAHVRLTGLDSAETEITHRLLQDIAEQVDKMLRAL
jgi:ParB-like chromosome segregation protein Spo0J